MATYPYAHAIRPAYYDALLAHHRTLRALERSNGPDEWHAANGPYEASLAALRATPMYEAA